MLYVSTHKFNGLCKHVILPKFRVANTEKDIRLTGNDKVCRVVAIIECDPRYNYKGSAGVTTAI